MDTMVKDWNSWTLNPGERVVECFAWLGELNSLQTFRDCAQCDYVPYKVLIIEASMGRQRAVQICGRHFVEACQGCSVRSACKSASGLTVPIQMICPETAEFPVSSNR
jgi:hypothetical protein